MKRHLRNAIITLLCLVAMMSGFIAVQVNFDKRYLSSEKSIRELVYFPSARAVKLISAGNELMMADYLWLRMIQYYGFHQQSDRNFEYLYPITDNLTDLDPKFLYPYTFGSLLLIHDAQDSVNSLKLLDKAKRANPDKWQFPYMKGFILYVFLHRSDEAVKEFVEASKLPKAWEGALRFAAWISRKEGQRETSKRMWQELYDKSANKNERGIAKFYLDQIYIEEEVDRYQSLAIKYHKNTGKWPENLDDLKAAGFVSDIPKDLFGGKYYWNREQNQVRNTTQDAFLRRIGKLK
ncbi:hypothetical protein HY768_04215 [candidate division TA06 bacterium]|uniref:Tetratricopeptide repeat protein n=1 Tax=candidate division TA06 bacterium TaxID=2250710 RepID=A0A933I8Z4_UNCT6|nr:hypothetical protein [candidate division TA06 bacterium]